MQNWVSEFLETLPSAGWDSLPQEQQQNDAFLFFFQKVGEVERKRAQAEAARKQFREGRGKQSAAGAGPSGYSEAAQKGQAKEDFRKQTQAEERAELQRLRAKKAKEYQDQFGEPFQIGFSPTPGPSFEVKKPSPPRPDKFSGHKKDALLLRDWIFKWKHIFSSLQKSTLSCLLG